jgi:hypothetical protein
MALTEPDHNFASPEPVEESSPQTEQGYGAPGNILDPGFNLTLRLKCPK